MKPSYFIIILFLFFLGLIVVYSNPSFNTTTINLTNINQSGGSGTDTTIDSNVPALNHFLRKDLNFSGTIDFNNLLCIHEDCRSSWPTGGSSGVDSIIKGKNIETNSSTGSVQIGVDLNGYVDKSKFDSNFNSDFSTGLSLPLQDGNIADNITISGFGSVTWTALLNYPLGCSANSAVNTLADSPTCITVLTSFPDLNSYMRQGNFDSNLLIRFPIKDLNIDFNNFNASNRKISGIWDFNTDLNVSDLNVYGSLQSNSTSSIDWTGLTNYPAGCGANTAIGTLGDTPTCVAALSSWPDMNGLMTKATFDGNFQIAFDSVQK